MLDSITFRISVTIWPLILLYFIVSNILLMVSLLELAVAGCERFRGAPVRSLPVAVGLSIMLNEAARVGAFIASGGNIKEW